MVAISNITGHTTIHFTHTQDQFSRIIPFCPIPKAMYPLDRLLGRPLGGISTQFVRCWWRHRLHRSFRPNEYNSRARTVCQSHAQLLLGWETIPDCGRVQNDPPGRRDVCDNTWFQLDIYWQITRSRSHVLGRRIGVALGKDRFYPTMASMNTFRAGCDARWYCEWRPICTSAFLSNRDPSNGECIDSCQYFPSSRFVVFRFGDAILSSNVIWFSRHLLGCPSANEDSPFEMVLPVENVSWLLQT